MTEIYTCLDGDPNYCVEITPTQAFGKMIFCKALWRRQHGERTMQEELWKSSQREPITEEEALRRNERGGILKQISWRGHLGGDGTFVAKSCRGHIEIFKRI